MHFYKYRKRSIDFNCKQLDIKYYRGSENNVLERFYKCAEH